MLAVSEMQKAADLPRGILREVTPFSLWGADTLIYKSVISMSAIALPVIAASGLYLRGAPPWPQLAMIGAIFLGALLCFALARFGRREIAAALLIGVLWFSATIFCFNSGYGMHSAAVFVYFPCVLYAALFFGLPVASAELALTVAVLVLMYLWEERGHLAGASAFVANGTNFVFLIGVILSSVGSLLVGVVCHRLIERETARVVGESRQWQSAMERAQEAQARLHTAHAKLQHLNDELSARGRSHDREAARMKRDIDLFHQVASKEIPASLRALRAAIARPDDQTEARLQRELGHIEGAVDALVELGPHAQPALRRAPISISELAHNEAGRLGEEPEFARVRFDIEAGLHTVADQKLLAALLRHLIKRAARACRAEPDPQVQFGSGSLQGRAVFFVRDNGPGMSAARDDTADIAIASAERIVERHGGELTIAPISAEGTTIYFSLPDA